MQLHHSQSVVKQWRVAQRVASKLPSAIFPPKVGGRRHTGCVAPLSTTAAALAFTAPQAAQGAPDLPDPAGDCASTTALFRCVNRVDDDAAASLFAVLQTMTELRQSGMNLAQLTKRLRTRALMLSKQRDLHDKADEIAGNNASATGRLVASGLGTGLAAVAAYFLRYQDLGISQAATGGFDYWDRNYGGQLRANSAITEQKQEQIIGQQEQMHVEAAGASYEQFKEARKNAQQAIMAHVQMVGEAVNNVWR